MEKRIAAAKNTKTKLFVRIIQLSHVGLISNAPG
jgi:hypothetical protein